MKKTLITLLALAGVAIGNELDTQTMWTVDFGSEYTNNYKITTFDGFSYSITQSWGLTDSSYGTTGGLLTSGKTGDFHRAHIKGDTGVSWDDDFVFTLNFSIDDANDMSDRSKWPVIACIGGSDIRFGPYLENNNYVNLDGSLSTKTGNSVALTSGNHTISFIVKDRNITLKLDDAIAATATLATTVTGDIADILLGGGAGDNAGVPNYAITSTIHSMSMSKIIPEPATATLSLLALVGLAARRRRK